MSRPRDTEDVGSEEGLPPVVTPQRLLFEHDACGRSDSHTLYLHRVSSRVSSLMCLTALPTQCTPGDSCQLDSVMSSHAGIPPGGFLTLTASQRRFSSMNSRTAIESKLPPEKFSHTSFILFFFKGFILF